MKEKHSSNSTRSSSDEENKKITLRNQLKSIEIENFKCISNVKLQCKPINLFIGENGTGKSSVFEIIGFFFQSESNMNTSGPIIHWGPIPSIFNKQNIKKNVKLNIKYIDEFSIVSRNVGYERSFADTYNCIIEISSFKTPEDNQMYEFNGKYHLLRENIDVFNWKNMTIFDGHKTKQEPIQEFGEYSTKLDSIFKETGIEYADYISSGTLTGSGSSSSPTGIWNLYRSRAFVLEDTVTDRLEFKLSSYIPRVSMIPFNRHITKWEYNLANEPPNSILLDDNGQSIATFLMYYKDRKYLDFWNSLEYWLKLFGFSNFELIPKSGPAIMMDVIDIQMETPVNLKSIGSGMNTLIGLIVKCILSEKGDILLIEEPEAHLHPKFQALIVDLIVETAGRGIQIFITTHSEYVLLHIQTKIADGTINNDNVAIHEFIKSNEGSVAKEIAIDNQGLFKNGLPSFLDHTRKEFDILKKRLNKSSDN